MRFLKLVSDTTNFKFMRFWRIALPLSILCVLVSIASFFIAGLNYGIEFQGGTSIELRAKSGEAQIADLRTVLSELNLGQVQVQSFGNEADVLVRIESQGLGDVAEQEVLSRVRAELEEAYEFRRVEVIGPTVSQELRTAGLVAVLASLVAIMIYIWFRFEWHFAVGAIVATLHDVILTIGFFDITQIEFSVASIAAILTVVGYSLNDTVVVYDRVRENLRRYKKMPLEELIDVSINQMLGRTLMTSITTLLALFALYFLGGEVIRNFTAAMIFGIAIGTYSSIFIAGPVLILLKLRSEDVAPASDS
jgi:SecD/SecF fusion protein